MRERAEDPAAGARSRRRLAGMRRSCLLLAMVALAAGARADEVTGYVYRFNYTGEVFGDVSGGERTGAVYTGLLQGTLDWHWGGWTAHGDLYFPHGQSLTEKDVGDFSVLSN